MRIRYFLPRSAFQSTLPRRERPRAGPQDTRRLYFNPRSHEGSDIKVTSRPLLIPNFNPRSHEGSDGRTPAAFSIKGDFNPRSHEGSDEFAKKHGIIVIGISIHAPTKGATEALGRDPRAIPYFNPRSHEGSDLDRQIRSLIEYISIHAPTKGATAILYNKFLLFHIILTYPSKDT